MARAVKKTPAKKPTTDVAPPLSACVAIAAPAEGAAALETLFGALPADTHAAFVVSIAHADWTRTERALKAIADASGMSASVAADGVLMQPNCIYVASEADIVTVDAGRLRTALAGPDDGRIDSLLASVAEAYEEAAIIVVLDGLGAEGTTGVAATKRCGGFSLAEGSDATLEPERQAVTAAGIADIRAPVAALGPEIASYIANLVRTRDESAIETLQADVGQQIARIATILRNATGNDFHGYKHATFLRRIQRRMQVAHIDEIDAYVERLRGDPGEVHHLFQDLLIGVTQFFRDPHEFEVLEREVIPKLFEGKSADDRIRVWVLGCATGEEAYSLAIVLREQMAHMDTPPHVQIFATDIDARALAVARSGRYSDSIARHVAPERLARWFVKEGATYAVAKELREMCIFSPHNLIKDAPFSRIDLLSCRNLLIYLNAELQERVIPIFHFSLKPGGHLFLGPAENVTRHQKLFIPIDRKNRIFRRVETPNRILPDLPLSPRLDRAAIESDAVRRAAPRTLGGRIGRRIEQVAERYAPAYVVVDEHYDVLHFSGRTGRFLEPATGAASLNLLNLVNRDLRLDLRAALHKATAQGVRVEVRNVRMGGEGQARAINIVIEPLPAPDEARSLMVLFSDAGAAPESGQAEASIATDELVQRLEAELGLTKERLQTTIEELETTNEELKSSNEEYQSINEELQSANEELETSKEELQAVNEELQTVNGELAHRVTELGRANSDLKNLLESTQVAAIFLDNDLRLRSFTPSSAEVFRLVDADVGRPIAHILPRIAYPELQDDARKVLKSLGHVEREVAALDEDRQFLVRVLPYRSVDNFIAGVVATFLEITGTARAEAALRTSERRFAEAQNLAGIGVWEWNLDSDETWWSPVVYGLWGLKPGDAPPPRGKRPVHPDDRTAYERVMAAARKSGELRAEWRVVLPDGSVRWIAEIGHLESSDGVRRLLGVTQDITDRKQTETRLKLLLGELQHRVRNILAVVRSIVSRTVRSSDNVDDLAAHLDGRLDSLARTQGVFARNAAGAVDLEEMIRDEMVAVAAREEQVSIEGPSIRLRREAAETVALALHELTTNAVKYGALSEHAGRLSVTWRVVNSRKGPQLALEWRESGVRALDTHPTRSGFGRELIERGLPYELGAETSLDFAPGGVRAHIALPLSDKIAELDEADELKGTGA